MFSLGQGMITANPSMKYLNKGDKNDSWVISESLTVTELKSMASVTKRTWRLISADTSFKPSENKKMHWLIMKYIFRIHCKKN